jgi:hypothetical protein
MAAAATSKMGQAVAFVLEFRDAIDHEIVGQGLKTGCRDGIAEDVMRPGHRGGGCHRHIARNQASGRSIKRCGPRLTG